MELDDVGHVKKIRMAIDGKGNRSSWFLEKVSAGMQFTLNLIREHLFINV